MRKTFGSTLLDFSNTVDILERESFKSIESYIEQYLRDVMDIKYVRLMLTSTTLGGQVMLNKYALNAGNPDSLLVKDRENNYNGQMAYAFSENHKLWITASDECDNLNDCKTYVEHWSKRTDLPKYILPKNEKIKTSIIIPIRRDNKIQEGKEIFGVVNFESMVYLPMTVNAKKELLDISYALGKLFQLHEGRQFQRDNTTSIIGGYAKTIANLNETDKEYFYDRKPKIFFAYSDRSDPLVTDMISQSLKQEFKDKVELLSWKDNTVGTITPQLMKSIQSSEYFICYLSEKDEAEVLYKDNPNVLFELGYFIGKHEHTSLLRNVLIIRESKSVKDTPFDIKDIFTIDVPRDEVGNTFDEVSLMTNLSVKLKTILSDSKEV